MARFERADAERTSALLSELGAPGGSPGPMLRAMAAAPVVLRGYLGLNRALKRSHLDRRVSERVSLAVHQWLDCEYCLAAHTEAARKLGLSEHDIQLARQGTATGAATAALIDFALQVLTTPAEISDEGIEALRAHGYRDEQLAEVVALVSLQLLTGAFNLVAGIKPVDR